MNEINKRRLSILDGGVVFLISVTLLLATNLVFAFFLPLDAFYSSSYFYLVGAAELLAVGIPSIIYLLAKKVSFKNIFKNRINKEQAVLCVFLAIFAYPILGLTKILWSVALEALKIPILAQPLPVMDGVVIFIVATIAVSLIPGFSEEIVFRGIIQGTFQEKHKPAKAIILTSVFFMLMHGDVYSWTYTFAAGIILGVIYYYTGSLWATIIYHSVNNFIGVAISYIYSLLGYDELLQGSADILAESANMIFSITILFVAAVFCFGVCALLFWGLMKVSKKREPYVERQKKASLISYVPYIIGGFLMVIIAVLPVIVEMIKG